MFHKKQNSPSRYLASEGNIDKSANCLSGHGRAGLKKNECPRSTVHGWLMGRMLRAMGGPGLKNLGPCHIYLWPSGIFRYRIRQMCWSRL